MQGVQGSDFEQTGPSPFKQSRLYHLAVFIAASLVSLGSCADDGVGLTPLMVRDAPPSLAIFFAFLGNLYTPAPLSLSLRAGAIGTNLGAIFRRTL